MIVQVLSDRLKVQVGRQGGLNKVEVIEHVSIVAPCDMGDEPGELPIGEFRIKHSEKCMVLLLRNPIWKNVS